MSSNVRQTLRNAAGSKVFERNPSLNAWARYRCEVVKLKPVGRLRPFFVAEVNVLDTKPLKDLAFMAALPAIDRPNLPGTKAAILIPMDQEWSGGAMISCLMGITGDSPEGFAVGFAPDSPEVAKAQDYIDELTDEVRNPCFGLQFDVDITKVPGQGEQGKPDPKLVFAKQYTHIGDPLEKNKAHLDAWDAKVAAENKLKMSAP